MKRSTGVLRVVIWTALALMLVMPSLAYGQGQGHGQGQGQGQGQGRGNDKDRDDGPPGQSGQRGRGQEAREREQDDDDDDDGNRIGICHLTGNGGYVFISVSSRGNAAQAHERHGDIVGVDFDDDCPGVAADRADGSRGVIRIESPASGSSVAGVFTMMGYAVDCETGAAAGPVRLYRGGVNGTLLGGATVGTSVRDLAQVCGGGAAGLAAVGWSFTLNTTESTNGATQFTAAADTSGGRVQDSVIYNVMNANNLGSGGQCNPYYPTVTPLFPVNVPCTGGVTAAPTNVVATATSSTTATMTWSAAQGATSYVVLRSTSGPAGPYTTTLGPASTPAVSISGTQATLTGLNPGETYHLAVSATGPLGSSVAAPANPFTTSTAALVPPVVNVLRNPNAVGGAPAGVCPGAGPCTVRFSWTEPVAASHSLSYGVGPAGSGFTGSCSFAVTTSPTCDAVFNAPAGTLVHFQATSSASGSTVQTPELWLFL